MSAPTAARPPRIPIPGVVRRITAAPWFPWVVLAIAMGLAVWLLLWAGRATTFFYDDWNYVLERRDWSLEAILRPHNEHLQGVSVVIYKLLLETVGMNDYWVFRLALALMNVTTGVLLFVYGRQRVGTWPALALGVSLVVTAASWYNLLWAFMLCFVSACAFGLAAFLAFDRGTRRWDIVATACLCLSLASASIGVSFLVGAIVEWILREDRKRRWWVVGVPIALYGLWRVIYGEGSSGRIHNVPEIPAFIHDGYDDSVAALAGFGIELGIVLAFVLAALAVRDFVDPRRISLRLISTVVMALSFWALLALGRADQGIEADTNRYLYPGGLFVALIALELGSRYVWTRRALVAATLLLLVGAAEKANGVDSGGDTFRQFAAGGRPAATAYDVAGHLNPEFRGADPTQNIQAGLYLAAAIDYGTAGWTMEELAREAPEMQLRTDESVMRVINIVVVEVPRSHEVGAAPPKLVNASNGTASERDGCQSFTSGPPGSFLEVEVPAPGLIVRAGDAEVEVRLRRFGPLTPEAALGKAQPGTAAGVEILQDKSPRPWIAQLRSSAPFEACSSVPD